MNMSYRDMHPIYTHFANISMTDILNVVMSMFSILNYLL